MSLITFNNKNLLRRANYPAKEPLAKAVGILKKPSLHLLDVTAGLGRESFLLAAWGAQVVMLERHLEVAALLQQALEEGSTEPHLKEVIARIQLIVEDASVYLETATGIDVIYLDPMFPPSPKSAQVKKELQWLREVVGAGNLIESQALFAKACQVARDRVVVKRHRHGVPLTDSTPTFSLQGARCVFDVYLTRKTR